MFINFAIAAGEYADRIGGSYADTEEMKRELKGVPDDCPIVVYHNGKAAPVYGVDKTAGQLEIVAGKPGRVTDTWTAGQLRKRLLLCLTSCRVVVTNGRQQAPVYGFHRNTDGE